MVGTTNIGLTYKPADVTDTGTIVLRSCNIRNGKINLEDLVRVKTDIRDNQYIEKNDILICARNGSRALVGKCAIMNDIGEKASFGAFMAVYRSICYRYVYHYFNTLLFRSAFDNDDSKQINQVTQAILRDTMIPLPPFAEQERIVNTLNEALSLIELVNEETENIELLIKNTKSYILDLAIRGKLVPQDPSDEPASVLLERIRTEKEELIKAGKIKRDKKESVIFKGEDNSYYRNYENQAICIEEDLPFEIPSNWEWCNLSMIGTTNIGLTYRPEDIVDDGTMVLRSSNIINGKIDLTDLVCVNTNIRDNQYMEENDILICVRNGSKALVGKCAIFSGIQEKASFGAFMAVYRTRFYKYVYHFLNSNTFRSTFNNDDTKQINQLTQDMIKNALIPLPPASEQQCIVETIESLFACLDEISNSLN